jgi:meiotically up-regulated gene 157 (Mug157) protein
MINRRTLLKSGIAGGIALMASNGTYSLADTRRFISRRPAVASRKFVSPAVEEFIVSVKKQIADPEIAWMFENCYPNTLDTTVHYKENGGENGAPDTFIITGDITAMWLRDSSAQVWHYLPLVNKDAHLKRMFQGLIYRQASCILLDPYANAFLEDPKQISQWATDDTVMKPGVHEHKWEVDSLCYPVRLAHGYWKQTGDTSPFNEKWLAAMDLVVKTFKEQQRFNGHGSYYFQRDGATKLDLTKDSSYGIPVKPNGMIYSAFRPSDDSSEFPFIIASNFFAKTVMRSLAEMMRTIFFDAERAAAADQIADQVEAALTQYAAPADQDRPDKIFAFEIDGFGHSLFMDDAGVPGLLSLPYLDSCTPQDPTYVATRKYAWSKDNPWFFKGKYEGIGSPHTGPGTIWPMGTILYGITSTSTDEISAAIAQLKATHAGTGFIHESFNMDNPSSFSRPWFAWVNSLFGEFIAQTLENHPELLTKKA